MNKSKSTALHLKLCFLLRIWILTSWMSSISSHLYVHSYLSTFSSHVPPHSFDDLLSTELLILVAGNVTFLHVPIYNHMERIYDLNHLIISGAFYKIKWSEISLCAEWFWPRWHKHRSLCTCVECVCVCVVNVVNIYFVKALRFI